jgi:hypothetical protein
VDGYDDAVVVFMSDHGYQLGEFGLWDKETNFAMATNAPFMIRVPGRTTPYGINSNQLAQGVDVFPTVVAAALGHPVPPCPKDSSKVATCTQGVSLLPLTYSPHSPVNVAAFSVHPSYWKPGHALDESARSERFDVEPLEGRGELTTLKGDPRSPCLGSTRFQLGDEAKHSDQYLKTCIMGSSMSYIHEHHELRYTEWSAFAGPETNWQPDWDELYAVELYNHSADPSESHNLADCHGVAPRPCLKELTKHHPALYKKLRRVLHDQVASAEGRRALDEGKQQQQQAEQLEATDRSDLEAERKEKRKEEAAAAKERAFEEEAKEIAAEAAAAREAEAKRRAIEDEAKQDAKAQAATRRKEKKAAKRKAAEEAARAKQAAEEEARRQQQEEEARRADEEKVAKRKEAEEAEERAREEAEARRKAAEEEANLKDEDRIAKRMKEAEE